MKEVDLIFERFLAAGYPRLDPAQRAQFERLLECMDQDIYSWLAGSAVAADEPSRALIDVIRATALPER